MTRAAMGIPVRVRAHTALHAAPDNGVTRDEIKEGLMLATIAAASQ